MSGLSGLSELSDHLGYLGYCYDSISFRAVAAVRPASLTLVSPISVATIADAMCSMDVFAFHVSMSRATGSFTRTFPFPSHVTLTVLVCVMATRLDSSLSCLHFLAYASYSSPVMTTRL